MSPESTQEEFSDVVMPDCPPRKFLAGQKALVTGANSGIGKATAIALGEAGADVVVNFRSPDYREAAANGLPTRIPSNFRKSRSWVQSVVTPCWSRSAARWASGTRFPRTVSSRVVRR